MQTLERAPFSNLSQAIDNVTKLFHPNPAAISASFQVVNGFLVYRLAALDSGNKIHVILVDPTKLHSLSIKGVECMVYILDKILRCT